MSQVWGGVDYGEFRRRLEVALDTGIVAAATDTALTDVGKSWADNIWSGMFVEITGGRAVGQIRRIVSNTSNTLVVSPAWNPVPATGDTYRVFNPVTTISISGDISLASGTGPITAKVSGETVSLPSTQPVKISGESVSLASGTGPVIAKVSGEVVQTAAVVPTRLRPGFKHVPDLSGGVELGSGPINYLTIRNTGGILGVSGHLWVGGHLAGDMPYSGFGVLLMENEVMDFNIDNLNKVRVFATVSGVPVNFFTTVL